ncbi:MAG TPA: hypothetical protein DEE98_02850 [Elusimicrobia bacterium]|nr:MAG: hypothetical protein A2278_07680 [Elusimicrobia bacterium RIFOXYA12_FULL_49_49]OGS10039.1 MAG: hypothetical protein A2204_08065 [Elusimicrobia bacterium RIFOXYA1_FULL_47_7]OGS10596.1 MAG: hypothetical protein A2386_00170 [Elusimicrobia bacterium RIFOXYB1_FULL_48_9]OGS16054.1 MAG: hypothetical protein A2251_02585 [Elusimicrobia bacterium RIFOXYA2_FULL_47_53]OGS25775.1 MAG: hypothetical protein A2339_05050 [Elusimicrobia bacterium RIFOXYB12_FULL_50_12]OGS30194.1 MAG: hypothetical protein
MRNNAVFLLPALLLASNLSAQSEVAVGAGFSPLGPASGYSREKKQDNQPDRFALKLAEKFDADAAELGALFYRGYGRGELIQMLLIARESKTLLKNLVRKRDRNTKLSSIAKDRGLDYDSIYALSSTIKYDIEKEIALAADDFTLQLSSAEAPK